MTNSANKHLGIEKRKKLMNWFNNVCKEAVDNELRNELRKTVLQNPSISDTDRYEAQKKITNKEMIEDLKINRSKNILKYT